MEGLSEALRMEVEEDKGSEVEEGGGGTLRELEALEFLTQEAEPSGTTLVDARNGFNELSRLAMLWIVRHLWPAEARFVFNCYKHWAQLLLFHPGELPVTILSREVVTQLTPSLWFCTVSPSSPWRRSSEQRIRGSSPLSTQMMRLLMVWHNAAQRC